VRLNINLATKPYQDVRRILVQWGGLVVALAVCTVVLIWIAVSSWRENRVVSSKITGLRSEIAALDKQHSDAVAMLTAPQNTAVVDTSKFLNGLIARKSFSWTRVFMQLEQIMPPRLHIVSILPVLQPQTNTMEVHLTVAGTSRDAALELVKRLEQSSSFRDARISEESEIKEKTGTDTIAFKLTAVYVPQTTPQQIESKTPDTKVAEARGGSR
jgi:type IV pilus assembly protein PilN